MATSGENKVLDHIERNRREIVSFLRRLVWILHERIGDTVLLLPDSHGDGAVR